MPNNTRFAVGQRIVMTFDTTLERGEVAFIVDEVLSDGTLLTRREIDHPVMSTWRRVPTYDFSRVRLG